MSCVLVTLHNYNGGDNVACLADFRNTALYCDLDGLTLGKSDGRVYCIGRVGELLSVVIFLRTCGIYV